MNIIFGESKKNKIKRYLSINFLLYIFGRFKLIRFMYKNFNIIKKKFISKHIEPSNNNYMNFDINNQTIINKLKKEGFCEGLKLNNNILNDLMNLSNKSELNHMNQRSIGTMTTSKRRLKLTR